MIEELAKFGIEVPEEKSEDVKSYLEGLSKIDPERAESFLESEEGKRLLQPRLDKYFSKGLETWKEKTLPEIVDSEVSKRMPTETEEQKRIRQLEEQIQSEKSARITESARNKALSYATEKGIPASLVEFAVSSDIDKTMEKMNALSTVFNEAVSKAVEGKFKDNGRSVSESEKGPASLQDEIRAAEVAGDFKKAIALKNKMLMQKFAEQ